MLVTMAVPMLFPKSALYTQQSVYWNCHLTSTSVFLFHPSATILFSDIILWWFYMQTLPRYLWATIFWLNFLIKHLSVNFNLSSRKIMAKNCNNKEQISLAYASFVLSRRRPLWGMLFTVALQIRGFEELIIHKTGLAACELWCLISHHCVSW